MREKPTIALAGLAGLIIAWNLLHYLLNVPDEANQGAIFRIIYFHLPFVMTSFIGFYVAMGLGIAYLIKKDLRWTQSRRRSLKYPSLWPSSADYGHDLGSHYLGNLVGLGPSPDILLYLPAALRGLPDDAARN